MLVINIDENRDLPDCRPVAPKLIGTDHVWNGIFSESPD